MFDRDSVIWAANLLADPDTPGIDKVYAANQLQRISEAAEAEAVATLTLADEWTEDPTRTHQN